MDAASTVFLSSGSLLRIVILILLFPLLRYVSRFIGQTVSVRLSRHLGSLVSRFIFYGGCIFIVVDILDEFGFNITALMGAAGIFGIAIGFASKTSISNIISGFFLLLEYPFSIGDTIKSGEIYGIVEAIDLLATRIRTNDNKLIRIPNEMVLKHPLTNVTHYKERRLDFVISVPYTVTGEKIIERLKNAILTVPLCLPEKKITITVSKIGQLDYDTEIRLFLSAKVWVLTENFFQAPGVFMAALKQSCENEGIKITVVQENAR
jgi:small conductance mechanosensitive channel